MGAIIWKCFNQAEMRIGLMSFCPDWVFDIAVAKVAMDFLSTDVPIYAVSNKYAEGLSEKYSSITKEQISEPAESVLHFLAEVNAGDEAVTFLNGFVQNLRFLKAIIFVPNMNNRIKYFRLNRFNKIESVLPRTIISNYNFEKLVRLIIVANQYLF